MTEGLFSDVAHFSITLRVRLHSRYRHPMMLSTVAIASIGLWFRADLVQQLVVFIIYGALLTLLFS